MINVMSMFGLEIKKKQGLKYLMVKCMWVVCKIIL